MSTAAHPSIAVPSEGSRSDRVPAPELGGFLTADPCELTEITRRFGAGDYRVTAYQIDPPILLWEVIATDVRAAS